MSAIEKQRHILDFTLSSLGRRKGRNIALVIVYTFVLFVLASVLFLTDSLKKEAALILRDAPEMTIQRLVAGRQDLIPKDYIESIKGSGAFNRWHRGCGDTITTPSAVPTIP